VDATTPSATADGLCLRDCGAASLSLAWASRVDEGLGRLGPVESSFRSCPQGWPLHGLRIDADVRTGQRWRHRSGRARRRKLSQVVRRAAGAASARTGVRTSNCVTGGVKNVHWAGVRLRDIFARSEPHSTAHGLQFVSQRFRPSTICARQGEYPRRMLAYEMDGKPLLESTVRRYVAREFPRCTAKGRQVASAAFSNMVRRQSLGTGQLGLRTATRGSDARTDTET